MVEGILDSLAELDLKRRRPPSWAGAGSQKYSCPRSFSTDSNTSLSPGQSVMESFNWAQVSASRMLSSRIAIASDCFSAASDSRSYRRMAIDTSTPSITTTDMTSSNVNPFWFWRSFGHISADQQSVVRFLCAFSIDQLCIDYRVISHCACVRQRDIHTTVLEKFQINLQLRIEFRIDSSFREPPALPADSSFREIMRIIELASIESQAAAAMVYFVGSVLCM